MKYFLACLIIPTILSLFIAVFVMGALYFCIANLLEQVAQKKLTGHALMHGISLKAPGTHTIQIH